MLSRIVPEKITGSCGTVALHAQVGEAQLARRPAVERQLAGVDVG
jgi:hypothetical protein